jgi:hypothetical protein
MAFVYISTCVHTSLRHMYYYLYLHFIQLPSPSDSLLIFDSAMEGDAALLTGFKF